MIDNTAPVTEFSEGTFNLAGSVWYCTDHSTKMKPGFDCPFCMHEQMSDQEFEKWIGTQL